MDYKNQHEAFISNNNGSTLGAINPVLLLPNISVLIFFLTTFSFFRAIENSIVGFFIEFIILVLPSFFCVTIFSNYVLLCCWFFFLIALFIINNKVSVFITFQELKSIVETKLKSEIDSEKKLQLSKYRPSFISNARSFVFMQTALCILAVDFQIFPRQFAKTESVGLSLMDIGVGLFIVCNSIIDPLTRNPANNKNQVFITMQKALVSSWPLLACFFVRLVSLKQLDYQEHVSEYGVHWNFFLTLASLKILSASICQFVPLNVLLVSSLILSISYEIILEGFGFKFYIFSSERRHNIIDMNKEGIFSMVGSYCLYVLSLQLGKWIHDHYKRNTHKHQILSSFTLLIKITSLSLFLWLTLFVYQEVGLQVSRRCFNVGYVLWTMATCTMILAASLYVEIQVFLVHKTIPEGGFEPRLLRAVTHSSFVYFLVANLLTGFVNMIFNTINISIVPSMFILFIYLLVLNGSFVILYVKNIKVKFW